MSKKIEFIDEYILFGVDWQYNDNHGELVRCENCRYFKKYPINTEGVECGRCSLLMIEKHCDGYCDEGKQKVAETGGDDSGRTD